MNTQDGCSDQEPEPALLAEQGEGNSDEQPDPQSGDSARERDLAAGEPSGDLLDGPQLGALSNA
jgi:hypothetical protein